MRAVVIYESVFGNTHQVAEAVAAGLGEGADVTLTAANDATAETLAGAELVVVGGPTHMHGMASPKSRELGAQDAAKGGIEPDPSAEGPGLRDWLGEIPKVRGVKAAAFDTRGAAPALVTGSAAKGIARRLRHHGYDLIADPESFVVEDSHGPLKDGELERAQAWGTSLAVHASA